MENNNKNILTLEAVDPKKKQRNIKTILFESALVILLFISIISIIRCGAFIGNSIIYLCSIGFLIAFGVMYIAMVFVLGKDCTSLSECTNIINKRLGKFADILTIIIFTIDLLNTITFFVLIFLIPIDNAPLELAVFYVFAFSLYINTNIFPILYLFRKRRITRLFLKIKLTFLAVPISLIALAFLGGMLILWL